MIASFFQSLEDQAVEYLLISGQATVLYGAATFSEDIDLWVNPTEPNRIAFLRALARRGARHYKLTPPFTLGLLRRGHGFHFLLSNQHGFFVDVMGRPPRAPSFGAAKRAAHRMRTPWGNIPTIGIKHLVEIKKTQRLGDYAVISQLVLRRLEALRKPRTADYQWAIDNIFTIQELRELLLRHPNALRMCRGIPALRRFAGQIADKGDAALNVESAAERFLTRRMLTCQKQDRVYWRPIIADLRAMKRNGRLMSEGSRVAAYP